MGAAAAATRADLDARADEIAGGLAMNPYYRCYEAADGFLAVACLNLAQRQAFLALFGLDDPTIAAPDVVPDDAAVLAAKQQRDRGDRAGDRGRAGRGLARAARGGGRSGGAGARARDGARRSAGAGERARRRTSSSPASGRSRCSAACSGSTARIRPRSRPAPALGADTEAVLAEVGA